MIFSIIFLLFALAVNCLEAYGLHSLGEVIKFRQRLILCGVLALCILINIYLMVK